MAENQAMTTRTAGPHRHSNEGIPRESTQRLKLLNRLARSAGPRPRGSLWTLTDVLESSPYEAAGCALIMTGPGSHGEPAAT